MIPNLTQITELAGRVLAQVPADVRAGKATAGIYGFGFLGRWALSELRHSGMRIDYCFDQNNDLVGNESYGIPVSPASEISPDAQVFIFITARHSVIPVSTWLTQLSIAHVSFEAFYVAKNLSEFISIHDQVLSDERSKCVLRSVMMAMLSGRTHHLEAVYESNQYFCLPRFCGFDQEVYVDAGAYTGDSLERFIWANNGIFKRAMAFEPGARQYAALSSRANRLIIEWALESNQISLINSALGDQTGYVHAVNDNSQLTNLTFQKSGNEIAGVFSMLSLDEYLCGNRISLIKADVEGMELSLLEGARKTIEIHQPKLAICVYHYPGDIPTITNYLKSLVPDYCFALRHHSPRLLETVLYAWIE